MENLNIKIIDGNIKDFEEQLKQEFPSITIRETRTLTEGATVVAITLSAIDLSLGIVTFIINYLKKRPNTKIKLIKTSTVISNADEEKYMRESIEFSIEK